jgi:hypothetical protein
MSQLKGVPVPRGDMGLGYCNACILNMKLADPAALDGFLPQLAITMAPSIHPIPGPNGAIVGMGIVALPTCWDHLAVQKAEQKRPILLADRMPAPAPAPARRR